LWYLLLGNEVEIMSSENATNGLCGPAVEKQKYQPPQLIRYGAARVLTQSGSAGGAESSGMLTARMTASDRNLKENIVRIGTHPLGIGLYLFDYKSEFRGQWGAGRQFGVMAQEVETVMPEAVDRHADGYKVVNYALLGISRAVH